MIEKDLGFVIRRYNFRETSLITTLYTKNYGKIRGIFKGFYTQKREFSSPLDVFSLNEFIFYPKRSEIWLISHADLVSEFSFLRTDLPKAKTAAIFFNLIDKTMQLWDSNPYIFDLLNGCLKTLEDENNLKMLCIFLIRFLTHAGFKPEFNHCISCNNLLGEEMFFSVSKGGLVCKACKGKVNDIRKISRQATQSLLYIQRVDFPLVSRLKIALRPLHEIFYILSEFLSYHFDFHDLIVNKRPVALAK